MRWKLRSTAALAAVAALSGGLIQAQTAEAASVSGAPVVVVSGLNNPRQLALAGNELFIAEAGKGGSTIVTNPDGSQKGFGLTGSVSAVTDPASAQDQSPTRIITGLLSSASATASPGSPVGSAAGGADGIAARSPQHLAIIETTFRGTAPMAQWQDGHLLLARPGGSVRPLADVAQYETTHDPDGQGVDSNPYSVAAYRDGWLVADAAGNDVLRVDHKGRISVFHIFENIVTGPCAGKSDPTPEFPGCNFVPDALAVDGGGNVYVAGLGSLVPGAGVIVKLDSRGQQVASWSGFNSVTGIAVGGDGALYVSQLFAPRTSGPGLPGVLTRVQDGQRTDVDVPFPAGVVVDRDNNVYVSAYSISPETGNGFPGADTSGQVWRVRF
jgi:hypothetical protein